MVAVAAGSPAQPLVYNLTISLGQDRDLAPATARLQSAPHRRLCFGHVIAPYEIWVLG